MTSVASIVSLVENFKLQRVGLLSVKYKCVKFYSINSQVNTELSFS